MPTPVQDIVKTAQIQLFDPEGTRWTAAELVQYADAAQLKICEARPDQFTVTRLRALALGYRQVLLDDTFALIDIPNNATGDFRRIIKTDINHLDLIRPGWRKQQQQEEIRHFMHGLDEPRVFYVYPPASATAQVEETVALYPAALPVPNGPQWSTVTGSLTVARKWDDTVYNFVMFKAYSKDAEFGGNPQLAAGYKALFMEALGIEAQTTAAAATAAS